MKLSQHLLPIITSLTLAACGGGGGSSSNAPGQAEATWSGTGPINFGRASVGSTTVLAIEVTNTGTAAGDFSHFDGLPSGVTAEGCSSVAVGAKCSAKFSFSPTATGIVQGYVSPSGVASTVKALVRGEGVAAVQALTMHGGNPGTNYWSGSLSVQSPTGFPLVLRDIRTVVAADGSESCSVTFQGSYPTELAGKHLEVGLLAFTIPAEGTVSTAGNVTTTTFTQPVRDFACWYIPYSTEVTYLEVKMY